MSDKIDPSRDDEGNPVEPVFEDIPESEALYEPLSTASPITDDLEHQGRVPGDVLADSFQMGEVTPEAISQYESRYSVEDLADEAVAGPDVYDQARDAQSFFGGGIVQDSYFDPWSRLPVNDHRAEYDDEAEQAFDQALAEHVRQHEAYEPLFVIPEDFQPLAHHYDWDVEHDLIPRQEVA
jgi:hypothetical protein